MCLSSALACAKALVTAWDYASAIASFHGKESGGKKRHYVCTKAEFHWPQNLIAIKFKEPCSGVCVDIRYAS